MLTRILVVAGWAGAVFSPVSAGAITLSEFLQVNAQSCATGSVRACFFKTFAFVDQNSDSRVEVDEARARQQEVTDWFARNGDRLHPLDRQGVAMTLMTIDLVGLNAVVQGYDFNGDGGVDSAEISADLALDDRPVGEWIKDPDSIDWSSMAGRLGPGGLLLKRLLASSGLF